MYHLDAWLISYADLITLLFMLFVIIVSVSVVKDKTSSIPSQGELAYGTYKDRSGMLALGTPFDEPYRNLLGMVTSLHADQNIAVSKSTQGVWLDISSASLFEKDSVDLNISQKALLKSIAHVLHDSMNGHYLVEVEGHTDDAAPNAEYYSDNWDLAARRAARVVAALAEEGIDPSRLSAVSYGSARPLVPNFDSAAKPIEKNRMRNQRIVIRLMQPPAKPVQTLEESVD